MNPNASHLRSERRRWHALFILLSLLLGVGAAHAQWETTTYTLKGGWNAIYLTGDAKHDTLDNLFPVQVLEVWRWNPNPSQVQFTVSPSAPSAGTPEWNVWRRALPAENTFAQLTGQAAYLVKCAGTAAHAYPVSIKQSPLPPVASWVRNGANLLGFPTYKSGTVYPTIVSYFGSFPAAIAPPSKVFKYIGGDLGPANPFLVPSTSDRLDRTQAYWFSSEVVGNFYAPVDISSSNPSGLDFERAGSIMTVLVRDRGTTPITLTLTHQSSEFHPSGETPIAGDVPLTRHILDPDTLVWTTTPLSDPVAIAGQSAVELTFGVDRIAMTGAPDALYASLLRFKDNGNLMDVVLPVRAQKSSLTGLWVGDATIRNF